MVQLLSRPAFFCCFALVLRSLLFSQTQPSPRVNEGQTIQDLARRIASQHHAWGPALNKPNTSLSLKETARSGPTISYQLYASGLPHNRHYLLLSWPVTQKEPSVVLHGVTLDDNGLAVCAGKPDTCGSPDKLNDPIDLKLNPAKGEPFRVALICSDDRNVKAFAKTVPLPNQSIDKGCSIQSVLLTPRAEEVAIEGTGFEPSADLTFESSSSGERHSVRAKADADGNYFSVMLPYRQGEQHGTTQVTIKSSACSPVLTFTWGRQ